METAAMCSLLSCLSRTKLFTYSVEKKMVHSQYKKNIFELHPPYTNSPLTNWFVNLSLLLF